MAKLSVKLAGQPLFDWAGSRGKMRQMEMRLSQAAAAAKPGQTAEELVKLVVGAVFAMHGLFAEDHMRALQRDAITYYLLHLDTNDSAHPGKYRDHVARGVDFDFDLTPGAGGSVRVEVSSNGRRV
ncbi:MAG TPA: hypothetical protein VHY35_06155 [Stellaceae bacterium]|jgi:hypothetical protein|nr:hypothetical protein [Stellaceae bacterium]